MAERFRFVLLTLCVGGSLIVAGGCSATETGGGTATTAVTTPATTPERPSDDRLRIGVLIPTTGAGESIGNSIRESVTAEVDLINAAGGVNGSSVDLVFGDEQTESGLSTLIEEDVDAIVGPTSSLVALRQLPGTIRIPHPIPSCSPAASSHTLDGLDDDGYFFRTIPSDSLQIVAIAEQTQLTGASTVAVAYVDDPYGRGLASLMEDELDQRERLDQTGPAVGVEIDTDDLTDDVEQLLADDPGTIIILANESLGGRLLRALDQELSSRAGAQLPTVLVNDSVSTARQAISEVSDDFRAQIRAITIKVTVSDGDRDFPPFAAQAVDCVNLIALAAQQAGSDSRQDIRNNIGSISSAGTICYTFEGCSQLLGNNRLIDYSGYSGPIDLDVSGETRRARFNLIRFNEDGTVDRSSPFTAQARDA